MNIIQLAQLMSRSQNPMQLFAQAVGQSPQGQQVLRLMYGKTPEQFRGVLENMAKQQGTTLEQVVTSMGLRLPR